MPAAFRRRRYPSDTSAAEWALLEPLLPIPACQTKTGGHPEKWPRREIVFTESLSARIDVELGRCVV